MRFAVLFRSAALATFSLLVAGFGPASACPPEFKIGTYAIDKYSWNGGGASDLTYQSDLAENFYENAEEQLSSFPLCPTAVSRPTRLENQDVRKARLINNTSSSAGERESNHFIFFAGHGSRATTSRPSSLFLGSGTDYGRVEPTEINMGTSDTRLNRYFMAHSCVLFPVAATGKTAQSNWAPTFKGLRAMLGFESYISDNQEGNNLFYAFWRRWTHDGQTLFDAFWIAERDWGYIHLGSPGIHPGCLTAGGPHDFCQLNYYHQPSEASARGHAWPGTYYSIPVDSPSYP